MTTKSTDTRGTANLAALPSGAWAVYTGLAPSRRGCASALLERMSAMGFVPGAELLVEVNHGRGPVIVKIRGARVALGRGQAQQILVGPLSAAGTSGRRQAAPALLAGDR